MDSAASRSSLAGSLRELGDGLLGSVHDRIALLGLELQEEKFRLVQIFIWVSAIVFTGLVAITFATLTVVFALWETSRLAVFGGLTALYAGAFLTVVVLFRRYLARQPRPFAATLEEIEQDRACIRNEN